MTPTSYGGLGVPDGCGGRIRIGASEEVDDSPTSGAPSSISEGADVVGLDSVTSNQEGAQPYPPDHLLGNGINTFEPDSGVGWGVRYSLGVPSQSITGEVSHA